MNPLKPITDIMSQDLIQVMGSTPINQARKLYDEHHIHHLLVVDAEGKLEGVLSQSDFLRLLDVDAKLYRHLTVADLMTRKLAKLDSSDTVRTATNVFALNRFHALPVMEGDKPIGILTTHDMIKLMDSEAVELKDYK